MIDLSVNLTGDMISGLDKFESDIKGKAILSGVAAMGQVIYDEVKLNTSGMRKTGKPLDPPGLKTGTLDRAIYRVYSPERSSDGVKVYKVSVNKSKAPHWFLIEFGTSRAPAHPYIRPAASKMPEAIAAGMARMAVRMAEIQGES